MQQVQWTHGRPGQIHSPSLSLHAKFIFLRSFFFSFLLLTLHPRPSLSPSPFSFPFLRPLITLCHRLPFAFHTLKHTQALSPPRLFSIFPYLQHSHPKENASPHGPNSPFNLTLHLIHLFCLTRQHTSTNCITFNFTMLRKTGRSISSSHPNIASNNAPSGSLPSSPAMRRRRKETECMVTNQVNFCT